MALDANVAMHGGGTQAVPGSLQNEARHGSL